MSEEILCALSKVSYPDYQCQPQTRYVDLVPRRPLAPEGHLEQVRRNSGCSSEMFQGRLYLDYHPLGVDLIVVSFRIAEDSTEREAF